MMGLPVMDKGYYFTTRDLVTIAVLSAMGGVVSTYVGYLGKLINKMVGVPFGAGQFLAGLHIFWIVVAYALVRKPGSATLVGFIKGFVELMTGSSHGIVVLAISLLQGGTYDICMLPFYKRPSVMPVLMAAGLASATNVPIFAYLYLPILPIGLIIVVTLLAFCSGVIFGGYFGLNVLDTVAMTRTLPQRSRTDGVFPRERASIHQVAAAIFIVLFTVGGIYYFAAVYQQAEPGSVEVEGGLASPFTYDPSDFGGFEVTICAELSGIYKSEPARNYTGIPLGTIISRGNPENGTDSVKITASDGYIADFELMDVLATSEIILVQEGGSFRIIAKDYDASYWVRDVVKITVE